MPRFKNLTPDELERIKTFVEETDIEAIDDEMRAHQGETDSPAPLSQGGVDLTHQIKPLRSFVCLKLGRFMLARPL